MRVQEKVQKFKEFEGTKTKQIRVMREYLI